MVREELTEIIESLKDINGDTTHVEIKTDAGGFPKRIWETISAFANTPGGGIIILGIGEAEKSVKIVGADNPAKVQQDLASVCSQMIPPLRPLIEIHEVEGKKLVTAEIPEVSYKEKPCYYAGSGMMSGSFIRVADGDRRLTQYEVQGFLDGRGQPLYDIEPVPDASLSDLDPELIKPFIERVKEKHPKAESWSKSKILHTYRILTKYKAHEVPTLAGLLSFGIYPQQYFPGLVLHILVYPSKISGESGDFGERLLNNIKIEGSLVRAVPDAIKVIKRNLQQRTVVKGLFREDILEYPEVFLREAVTNAIGHRDYSPLARGTAVQIKIFPERIEIINSGGLFGPVTEDRLGEQGLQATRNAYLMKLLEDLPVPGEKQVLCENRGTGIPSMITALIKAGMEPPQFQDLRSQFRVVCYNQALLNKETLTWLEKYARFDLSERQRMALAHIHHKGKITNQEYCRMSDCDSRIATRELSELVNRKMVFQHGTGRWTFYTVQEQRKVESVPGTGKTRKDRRKEILAILSNVNEASRKEIENKIEMSTPNVLYWLRKLFKEGRIEATTKSTKDPNVKYRIINE